MNISLITPAPARSRKGNRVTALRWARILRGLGHRVRVEQEYRGRRCDLMVALHARRSFPSIERFRRQHPDLPLVLALTGTDLYGDIHTDPRSQRSLEMASRLVVLQPLGVSELPERLRERVRVVYQSAEKPAGEFSPHRHAFQVCVLGHLRPVKDPFRTAIAARLLPATSRIRVAQIGAALSEEMDQSARAEEVSNPRYHWWGELPQGKALRALARSRLLVLSSQMEGGANVISEAIAVGVPILASRIPGSIGILGPEYPGYFPAEDTQALATLLQRAETDSDFYQTLQAWCWRLRFLTDPARERQGWESLLEELSDQKPGDRGAASTPSERFTLIDVQGDTDSAAFAHEVAAGLASRPKRLPCRYFYDQEGSRLFEAICELPEYYLTRAETEILRQGAVEVASQFAGEITLVELGSGSASKTRILLEAFFRHQEALRYIPVDISRAMLEESARGLLKDYPALEILAVAGEYHQGLRHLKAEADRTKLILWLGSNLGNLERSQAASFLRQIGDTMSPRDRLLVGIDLRKDGAVLERAYDDSQGVTSRFNRNILARINRELGGQFDLRAFRHRAFYDEETGRVEMHLISAREQKVFIERLGLEVGFATEEAIHTENSYKYSPSEISALAAAAGLRLKRQWLDNDRRFSVNLFAPAE